MSPDIFRVRLLSRTTIGLTDSDLAVWFDRPRSTVASWLWRGHLPRKGHIFNELVRRLLLLEASPAFPFPYSIRQRARRAYVIEAFKNADNRGVPSDDTAIVGSVLPNPDKEEDSSSNVLDEYFGVSYSSVGKFDE